MKVIEMIMPFGNTISEVYQGISTHYPYAFAAYARSLYSRLIGHFGLTDHGQIQLAQNGQNVLA